VAWRLAAAAREVPRAQRVRALMSGSAGRPPAGRPEGGRPKTGHPADSRKTTAIS
jgi:hypothetical protein